MKRIFHILYLMALPIMVWSCIDAPDWSGGDPPPGNDNDIRINFNLNLPADLTAYSTRFFGGPEPSDTRALDWQGEVNVSDAYILVFDGYDLLVDIKAADGINQSGDGGNVSFTFTLSTGGTRHLVVLANSEAILRSTIGTNRNSEYIGWTYDSVMAQIWSGITTGMFTGDPPGYIPMWGETCSQTSMSV